MSTPATTAAAPTSEASILAKVARDYGLSPQKLYATLSSTIFPSKQSATPEQVQALLIVANMYGLSPFTREIWAFPGKAGSIVPIVSIDGWAKLMNGHPQMDGLEIEFEDAEGGKPVSCTARIYRKDRSRPVTVTEYLAECRRNTDPWNQSPHRMLRHRAVIQCIRLAFGFAGIYEPDEAARFAAAVPAEYEEKPEGVTAVLQAQISGEPVVQARTAPVAAPEPAEDMASWAEDEQGDPA